MYDNNDYFTDDNPLDPNRRLGWRDVPKRVWLAVIAGVLFLVSLAITWGTLSTSSLSVGDCFAHDGSSGQDRVDQQDCQDLHDARVIAVVESEDLGPTSAVNDRDSAANLEADHHADELAVKPFAGDSHPLSNR